MSWRLLAGIFFVVASVGGASAANQFTKQPTSESIALVVAEALGSGAKVLSDDAPYYLLGDFNGDSNQDLAVVVQVVGQREELRARGLKWLDTGDHAL